MTLPLKAFWRDFDPECIRLCVPDVAGHVYYKVVTKVGAYRLRTLGRTNQSGADSILSGLCHELQRLTRMKTTARMAPIRPSAISLNVPFLSQIMMVAFI